MGRNWPPIFWLLLVFFFAFLAYSFFSDPYYFGPHDGKLYFDLARDSVLNGAFRCGLYHHSYWPPAWIEIPAFLYRMFGVHPRVVQIFLIFCALGSATVVYLWAKMRMGELASLLAAFFSLATVFVFKYSTYHQYELMVAFFLLTASYLLIARSDLQISRKQESLVGVIAGLLVALSVLSAAKTVLVALGLFGFLLLRSIKTRRFLQILGYVGAGSLVASLWIVRNYLCFQEIIPLTTNGGIVFFMAHNPNAQLKGYVDPYSVYEHITPATIKIHESDRWYKLGRDYIAENPLKTLVNSARKFLLFFNPHYVDQIVVIALCLFSLILGARGKMNFVKDSGWWLALPMMFALIHSLYHFEPRYILPVWPFLSLFAAQVIDYYDRARTVK